MPTISVIVPIYNVEKYLSPCIESILNQTFSDFELILVDDGSPDKCGVICDEYGKKDNRIHVIHQTNGGLSAARNTGLDLMKGDYVTFVDSDDIICEDYLQCLYNDIVKYGAQISLGQLFEFLDPLDFSIIDHLDDKFVLTGRDAALEIYSPNSLVNVTACGKLYQKNLFTKIRFPIGKIHEDEARIPILFYMSQRVVVNCRKMYGYRVREDSIMHKKFSIRRYDAIDAFKECIAFFKLEKDEELVNKLLARMEETKAIYALYARKSGVYKQVPKKYKISQYRALKYLYNNMSDDRYTYQLSKIHPNWLLPHEYLRKIKRVLGIKVPE